LILQLPNANAKLKQPPLHGFAVEPHPNGDFLVSAHGLCHYAQDLEALQDFAIKLE